MKEMYENQYGEFICGYWGLKGYASKHLMKDQPKISPPFKGIFITIKQVCGIHSNRNTALQTEQKSFKN